MEKSIELTDEVVGAIYRVVDLLAAKFRFGYHNVEDMRQQGVLFALQALKSGRYDVSRPLENFLYTHVRNRFINYKRDNYSRAYLSSSLEGEKRNEVKRALMQPLAIDSVSPSYELFDIGGKLDNLSLIGEIERRLPASYRGDYLRMRDDMILPKIRRMKMKEVLEGIMLEISGEIE